MWRASELSRRAFLAASACVCGPALSQPRPAGRIVALDWVSGQSLLALGIVPLAMPELERYARLVVEPAAPASVRELGLRSEPNLEFVDQLAPDLIVLSPELEPVRAQIERIAPAMVFDPNGFGEADPLSHGARALQALAARLDAVQAYEGLARRLEMRFREAARRLHDYDGRPLYLATIIDGRRMLVFGRGSLFQTVLDRLGIENAWTGMTSRFGHVTLTVDRLSQRPEARLLCIGDSSRASIATLLASPVVASLPFVGARRIALIPDVLFYGGLPSAIRFVELASAALARRVG